MKKGLPLAGLGLYRKDQALCHTAKALFSSWRKALKAAGIILDTIRPLRPRPDSK